MASKKDNLPLNVDNDTEQTSSITYANEVVSIIAGLAAGEVEGIAGMCNISGSILSKNRNITKGVKVELGTEEAAVDVYLVIEYGTPIQTAAANVQENVRKAIESMTGLHVVRVDVHVQGVSFEKEQKETLEGLASLKGIERETARPQEPPREAAHVEFDGEPTPAEEHTGQPVEYESFTAEEPAPSQDEAQEQ